MEVLRELVREWAKGTGHEVDEAAFDRLREYTDETCEETVMPKHDFQEAPGKPLVPTPEQVERMTQAGHRVQTAIALFEGRRDAIGERFPEIEPKHLRVGVNSALIEASALANLLFRKGLFTADEYFDALIEGWDHEVERYSARVKAVDPRLEI